MSGRDTGRTAVTIMGDGEIMKFKVTYTETSTREVDIIADSKEEAECKVSHGDFNMDDSCETYSELAHVDYSEEIKE